MNRPADEDDSDRISPETARGLFAPLKTFLFDESGAVSESLQGEIWRALLFAMLIFLVGESYLSLPPARASSKTANFPAGAAPKPASFAGTRS